MKKILIIFLLSGCSFKPVADLRVSKEANHYQRDLSECKSLATEASSTLDKMITSVGYKRMVIKCLDGRGHSIINDI